MDPQQYQRTQEEGRKTSYLLEKKVEGNTNYRSTSARKQALIGLGVIIVFVIVLYRIFIA